MGKKPNTKSQGCQGPEASKEVEHQALRRREDPSSKEEKEGKKTARKELNLKIRSQECT